MQPACAFLRLNSIYSYPNMSENCPRWLPSGQFADFGQHHQKPIPQNARSMFSPRIAKVKAAMKQRKAWRLFQYVVCQNLCTRFLISSGTGSKIRCGKNTYIYCSSQTSVPDLRLYPWQTRDRCPGCRSQADEGHRRSTTPHST